MDFSAHAAHSITLLPQRLESLPVPVTQFGKASNLVSDACMTLRETVPNVPSSSACGLGAWPQSRPSDCHQTRQRSKAAPHQCQMPSEQPRTGDTEVILSGSREMIRNPRESRNDDDLDHPTHTHRFLVDECSTGQVLSTVAFFEPTTIFFFD